MGLFDWLFTDVLGLGMTAVVGIMLVMAVFYYRRSLGIAGHVSSVAGKLALGLSAVGFFIVVGKLMGWLPAIDYSAMVGDGRALVDFVTGPVADWLGRLATEVR